METAYTLLESALEDAFGPRYMDNRVKDWPLLSDWRCVNGNLMGSVKLSVCDMGLRFRSRV